ncbi:MAG: membrane dipeptidase, partial [Pseudomonadota bacterium]
MPNPVPIFDGHNDVLLRLTRDPEHGVGRFLEGATNGHLDLPRAKEGGFVGGLFAVFVPPRKMPKPTNVAPSDLPTGVLDRDYILAVRYTLEAIERGDHPHGYGQNV